MFCIECGSQLRENAKYCMQCGTPTDNESSQSSEKLQSVATDSSAATDEPLPATRPIESQATSQAPAPAPSQTKSAFDGKWVLIGILGAAAGIGGQYFKSNSVVETDNGFSRTTAGQSLYQCVASEGDLKVTATTWEKHGKGVEVVLKKNRKEITFQYAINRDINQAKLIGAEIKGEKNATKFSLMLSLELMCGGAVSARVLPDAYNALNLMNSLR